jgi:hypothetical protein
MPLQRWVRFTALLPLLSNGFHFLNYPYITAVAKVSVSKDSMKQLQSNACNNIVERFAASEQFLYSGRGPRKQLLQVFSKKEYIISSILDPRFKLKPYASKLAVVPYIIIT